MSDRKYRQRGYQDDERREPRRADRTAARPAPQRAPGRQFQDASGPRTPNLMASHEVFRCARCGGQLATPVAADARCGRCGVDVHSCINCVSFDTGARWECSQPALPARVSPKDERNGCAWFAPRTTIERETSTRDPGPKDSGAKVAPNDARQAFEDLFKN